MKECEHCHNMSTMLNCICDRCGFNSTTKKFSWIKVNLDKLSGQISLDALVNRHAYTTQRA